MSDLKNLFNEETIQHINNIVHEKMPILRDIPKFRKTDESLAIVTEQLENSLNEELREKLDSMINLNYHVEEYYFTLAYLLGIKCGKQIEKL